MLGPVKNLLINLGIYTPVSINSNFETETQIYQQPKLKVTTIEPDSSEYKKIINQHSEKNKALNDLNFVSIPTNYIPILRDIYGPKIKKNYKQAKSLEENLESITKNHGTNQETLSEMIKKYYNKKDSYEEKNDFDSKHYSNKILPSLVKLTDINNYETRLEILDSYKHHNLEKTLNKNAIYYNQEAQTDFTVLRYLVGRSNKPKTDDKKIKAKEKELNFYNNKNSKAKKIQAALYYSNLLQEFYKPDETYLKKLDQLDIQKEKAHNNLAQVSLLTGIRSSTIRYWARKLESDPEIKKLKENYL